MKKYSLNILLCLIILTFVFPLNSVLAGSYGLDDMAIGIGLKDPRDTAPNLISSAGTIVAIGLSLSGVIFFGLMLYGGNMWMTAKGNEEQVEKARKLIVHAVMGFIVAFGGFGLTYFLVGLLLKTTTGVDGNL